MNIKILLVTFVFLIKFSMIFCQPNAIATSSDINGNFDLVIPSIPVHVEVSHLGYQAKSIMVSGASKSYNNIRLLSREIHLKEITILGHRLKKEYIEKFTQGFLGTDHWG